MACTHWRWYAELLGTLASFGSLPLTGSPDDCRIPLPASGNHCQSLPVCAPYFACEKLASLPRFTPILAIQPIIGMVSSGCAPPALLLEMKVSPRSPATLLASPRLSKYQSCPRLSPLI